MLDFNFIYKRVKSTKSANLRAKSSIIESDGLIAWSGIQIFINLEKKYKLLDEKMK